VWDAQPLTELDPDEYYDFQVNRPTVSLVDGITRRITWPTTRFSYCRPPGAEFDLVLAASGGIALAPLSRCLPRPS